MTYVSLCLLLPLPINSISRPGGEAPCSYDAGDKHILKITSKEQTVTVERQGPGGREVAGLVSGVFQLCSEKKESMMYWLLIFSLDLDGVSTCVR